MPLNLNDLLKKAEKKGMIQQGEIISSTPPPAPLLRTWQQESILYTSNTEKPKQNLSQSEVKLESNLSQSEVKLESKLKPKVGQSEVKPEPNYPSFENSTEQFEPNLSQTQVKPEPKLKPNLSQNEVKVESKLSQTRVKVESKSYFSSLIGLQRKIVLMIHEICQSILEQQTNPLSIEFIAMQCKSPKSAVRKAIQRLEHKGIVIRAGFKNGRGGWTQYQLPDQIYQEILMLKNKKLEPNLGQSEAKHESNMSQTEAKPGTKLESEVRPSALSSSSFKETTTTSELPEEWSFDLSPYTRFGFTKSQLKQLALLNTISANEVEQSLIEFNYDIDNQGLPAIRTSKINFLMGLLRSGRRYVSERFMSEQEELVAEMARRAENKRKKLAEQGFLAWEASLNETERKKILSKLPTPLMVLEKTYGINNPEIKNWYYDYYLKHFTGSN